MQHLYPEPHPQTAGRVIDGEAVLILADKSEVNVLNDVGSRIFELADGSRSVAAIADVISAEYDVPPATAKADTQAFIDQMIRENVFQTVN